VLIGGERTANVRTFAQKKVVIVDDSRVIRDWLRVVLQMDHRLSVVGEAKNAVEARQIIKNTAPDVVTLDIEMPGMSGLDFLEKLMTLRPTPVVMIAGGTQRNSEATIKALSLGAVDCILKPTTLVDQTVLRDITRRVFSAACSNVRPLRRVTHHASRCASFTRQKHMPLILIGASTGGVAALETVLFSLDPNGPPVVIVQHMPGAFLVSFSQQLDRKLPQDVSLARENEILSQGMVRIAPGLGQHTGVRKVASAWQCYFTPNEGSWPYCPSVDHLFRSAFSMSDDIIAVILTGLGRDGAAAMHELHRAGSHTIGQDCQSSVVYGMPRAAWEMGAVAEQRDVIHIGDAVNDAVARHPNWLRGTPE